MKLILTVFSFFIITILSSCERNNDKLHTPNATILSADLRQCVCHCGGYFIAIDSITYRFFKEDLPENNVDLRSENFPLNVYIEWSAVKPSDECSAEDLIEVHKIE